MKKNNARFQNCGLIDSMNEPVTTDQLWPIEWSSGILPVSALWLWYLFDINKSYAPCGLPVARMHMANQGKSHMFILFASFCTYPGVAVGCQETLYLCSRCPTQMYPQMSWKGWENPSSFLYGFQCAPFFDRQKLIWRTLGAFRTNFWGEKWENQKQSRWVGCKQIQIRRAQNQSSTVAITIITCCGARRLYPCFITGTGWIGVCFSGHPQNIPKLCF